MICEIVTYGQSVLREPSRPVDFSKDDIEPLVEEMLESMYAANGLGLAAQQIGRTEAVCVIDDSPSRERREPSPSGLEMPLVLVNPQVVAKRGEQVGDEGCLSFPEIFVSVKRAAEVTVEYQDRKGNPQEATVEGLLARAVQHEVDHLNGILLVDHMSPVQKLAMKGKLKRLKKKSQSA